MTGGTETVLYSGTTASGAPYGPNGPTVEKPTEAGSYTVIVTYETLDTVYIGSVSFTIEPAGVVLTANSNTETIVYDGYPHIVEGFSADVDGLTFSGVTAGVTGTDAGTYDVTFGGVTVNETRDTTGNYVVKQIVPGTLTIQKAAGTISYAVTTVNKQVGDTAFTNALTFTGDGSVSYESGTPAVAAVDENGEVTIAGKGQTVIKAIAADSKNYHYENNTAEYKLLVELPVFTVTWKNWNGDVLEMDKDVPYGEMPSYEGDTPVKANAQYTWTFAGWDPQISEVKGNVTYTAKFDEDHPVLNTYTVIFDKNAADAEGSMEAQIFTAGEEKALSANTFRRADYVFNGWNTDPAGTGQSYRDGALITLFSDLTLYAKWIPAGAKSLSDETISLILTPEVYQYDGKEKTVAYSVYDSERDYVLVEGKDYVLDKDNSRISATDPGTYIVTVTADNIPENTDSGEKAAETITYYGIRSASWKIVKSGGSQSFFPIFGDDFLLPRTGFSSHALTELPKRPQGLVYSTAGLSIQIPRFDLETDLVLMPMTENSWAVEWLDDKAGLMEGSELPGNGYSLIAGHNTLNDTEYGPFARLCEMEVNDAVFVRNSREELLRYRVYANELIMPDDFETLRRVAEQEPDSLVLITCENESVTGQYLNRRVVFAKPVG